MPERTTFLHPGHVAFARNGQRIRTLLGSCVAVTLWHPETQEGAMCHFLLPWHPHGSAHPDGRYGEDALRALHLHFQKRQIAPEAVIAGLFGGGEVTLALMPSREPSIGARNIALGRELLQTLGYRITHEHVGGPLSRTILLHTDRDLVEIRATEQKAPKNGRRP